jgi:hypothetical protein
MSVVIHHCKFPESVTDQIQVWKIYHWNKKRLKAKMPLVEHIQLLCENWSQYVSEYKTESQPTIKEASVFKSLDKSTKTLTANRQVRRKRDTLAINKFKKDLLAFINYPRSCADIVDYVTNYTVED